MPYLITGVITEGGDPVAREVRAYDRATGALVDKTTSVDSTGEFGLICDSGDEHYVVAIDDADEGSDFNALVWDRVVPADDTQLISATGGTVTTDGDYKIHTFTSSGDFVITSGYDRVWYLVIGGGGAGVQGGGGAGGYRTNGGYTHKIHPGTYPITVGAGGTYVDPGTSTAAQDGQPSTFDTITAAGGGAGGPNAASSTPARTGGSGGGGGHKSSSPYTGWPGAAGTAGQGFAGGDGHTGGDVTGGGGGAGAAGSSNSSTSSAGGAGLASAITGSSVTRAGGGGGYAWSSKTRTGGAGGGGTGSTDTGVAATTPTANTGSGGGGGFVAAGSNGAAGVVIIRYKYQ